jgi:hypothetical protein
MKKRLCCTVKVTKNGLRKMKNKVGPFAGLGSRKRGYRRKKERVMKKEREGIGERKRMSRRKKERV